MEKVQNNSVVTVNYTGKFEDGAIFDSTLNEGRSPMSVSLGRNQVIKGFENALIGMSVGEKKTVEISAAEGYGESRQEMIAEIPRENVPDDIEVGGMLEGNGPHGPIVVRIAEIKENSVVIDGNHPLAGKNLVFDLEVVSIDESETE